MKKRLTTKTLIKICVLSVVILILIIWTIWGNTALMVNAVTISNSRIPAAFSGFRIALCFAQESVRIAPTYYVTGNHEAASPNMIP